MIVKRELDTDLRILSDFGTEKAGKLILHREKNDQNSNPSGMKQKMSLKIDSITFFAHATKKYDTK